MNFFKVIVLMYFEVGDFVCVIGEDDELWRVLIIEVNYRFLIVGLVIFM